MAAAKLQEQFADELTKYQQLEKDKQKYINNRQQLEVKMNESEGVKKELDLLEDDCKVYKMIGPVLVRQDLGEARATVDKRLEFIQAEIKRVDDTLKDYDDRHKSATDKLVALQKKIQG